MRNRTTDDIALFLLADMSSAVSPIADIVVGPTVKVQINTNLRTKV
jgi:hypothetical protein